jgi:hypothetical protein
MHEIWFRLRANNLACFPPASHWSFSPQPVARSAVMMTFLLYIPRFSIFSHQQMESKSEPDQTTKTGKTILRINFFTPRTAGYPLITGDSQPISRLSISLIPEIHEFSQRNSPK